MADLYRSHRDGAIGGHGVGVEQDHTVVVRGCHQVDDRLVLKT